MKTPIHKMPLRRPPPGHTFHPHRAVEHGDADHDNGHRWVQRIITQFHDEPRTYKTPVHHRGVEHIGREGAPAPRMAPVRSLLGNQPLKTQAIG